MPRIPTTINLGSGKCFLPDYINIDVNPYWGPDIVFDFGRKIGSRTVFDTDRFGEVRLDHDSFERILARDVLEHIPDLVAAMTNCMNLLRPDGEMHITVPHDLSFGAWQDPTHVRAFNENSWLYYTDWFWYLGWREARFDLVSLDFMLSELGKKRLDQGIDAQELRLLPRCIDEMRVVLKKRLLSEKEKDRAARYQEGRFRQTT